MFVTHEFYENSMSGANSYVNIFQTMEEARNEMYDSIRVHIAHCEKETMDRFIILLEGADETIEETVDGFTIQCDKISYYIVDNYGEDMYNFAILDIDIDDSSSF